MVLRYLIEKTTVLNPASFEMWLISLINLQKYEEVEAFLMTILSIRVTNFSN
jgi:hypothetical protein